MNLMWVGGRAGKGLSLSGDPVRPALTQPHGLSPAAGLQPVMSGQQQPYQGVMGVQQSQNPGLLGSQRSSVGGQMQGLMVQYTPLPSYQVSCRAAALSPLPQRFEPRHPHSL